MSEFQIKGRGGFIPQWRLLGNLFSLPLGSRKPQQGSGTPDCLDSTVCLPIPWPQHILCAFSTSFNFSSLDLAFGPPPVLPTAEPAPRLSCFPICLGWGFWDGWNFLFSCPKNRPSTKLPVDYLWGVRYGARSANSEWALSLSWVMEQAPEAQ